MEQVTIISGKDLLSYLRDTHDDLADFVDPEGTNVVDIAIMGEDSLRTVLLVKCLNKDTPVTVKMDFPYKIFGKISHLVTIGEEANIVH